MCEFYTKLIKQIYEYTNNINITNKNILQDCWHWKRVKILKGIYLILNVRIITAISNIWPRAIKSQSGHQELFCWKKRQHRGRNKKQIIYLTTTYIHTHLQKDGVSVDLVKFVPQKCDRQVLLLSYVHKLWIWCLNHLFSWWLPP